MLGSRAAAEAGPAAMCSLSTSMPFLYQTKTLSNWSLTAANTIHRPRYCNVILRRHYSDFRISRVPGREPRQPRLTITRTTNMSGREAPGREAPAAGSWTFDPLGSLGAELSGPQFGNVHSSSTSTPTSGNAEAQPFPSSWSLEPQVSRARRAADSGSELNNTSFDIERNEIGLDDGMGFAEESAFEDEIQHVNPFSSGVQPEEIQDLTRRHGARDSTITDTERAAFQKIFADIFKRSNRSSTSLESRSSPDTSDALIDDPFESDTVPRNMQNAKRNLGNILTTAMQRQPQSREAMEAALEKYPPPLRAAAATAMGYIEGEMEYEKTQPNRSALLEMKELEALREPERKRVEGLMNAASTDFELLEIMEKEVFSLIPKLGLDERGNSLASTPLKNKKKKGWKKAERAAETARKNGKAPTAGLHAEQLEKADAIINTTSDSTDDGVSPLALYGPLYPSYLLLGLRLLDRSFAKPSPLSLSILPRIKSLGYISRILGGSTQFYNELLRIYRFRHDDFRGMVELLREMEHSAVEFDEDTLWIVRDLRKLQVSISRGEKGRPMKALWAMPEFAPNAFSNWRDKIVQTIVEKENKARENLQFPRS